jgi:hypothetical protein
MKRQHNIIIDSPTDSNNSGVICGVETSSQCVLLKEISRNATQDSVRPVIITPRELDELIIAYCEKKLSSYDTYSLCEFESNTALECWQTDNTICIGTTGGRHICLSQQGIETLITYWNIINR